MRRSLLGMALLGITLSPLACSVTETGNPTDGDEHGGPAGGFANCDDTATAIEFGEVTSLGFSAGELRALVEGTHTEQLAWLETEYANTSGLATSDITVTLDVGDTARFVESQVRPRGGGLLLGDGAAGDCPDRVELDATLHISTADGMLDETAEVVVRAMSPRLAHADFDMPAEEAQGNLDFAISPPEGFEPNGPSLLNFKIDIAEVGFAGKLSGSGTFQSSDGQVGFGGGDDIAVWPATNPCQWGFPVPAAESQTLHAALEAFNGRGPLRVSYAPSAPDAELDYELTPDAEVICEELDGTGLVSSQTSFVAKLALESSDGSVASTFDVEVTAHIMNDGSTPSVSAMFVETSEAPSELLSTLGIDQTVDFAGYDYGQVRLLASEDNNQLTGELMVSGALVPDCIKNPPPPDPDGMGAPGCEGVNFVPLWTANFVQPE